MSKLILRDKQQFKQYQAAYRQLAHAKQTTAVDHILYNLLRGKDLKLGFTPITNEVKLDNDYHRRQYRNFGFALHELQHVYRGREQRKRYFATYGGRVPICLYYGDIITPEQWLSIEFALGEHK